MNLFDTVELPNKDTIQLMMHGGIILYLVYILIYYIIGSKIIKMMFLNIPILAFETEKTKEILDKENLFNNSEQLIKKMFEYIENENNYQDYQDLEKYKLENVLNISEKIYKEINSKK